MAGPVDAAPGEGGAAKQGGAASLVFRVADLESPPVRLLEFCLRLSEEACQPEGTRPRDREWHRVACPTARSRRSDHHAVPPPSPRDGARSVVPGRSASAKMGGGGAPATVRRRGRGAEALPWRRGRGHCTD